MWSLIVPSAGRSGRTQVRKKHRTPHPFDTKHNENPRCDDIHETGLELTTDLLLLKIVRISSKVGENTLQYVTSLLAMIQIYEK